MATQEGLPNIGLVGVILLAKRHHIIPSTRHLILRLESEAGMYLATEIKEKPLRTVGE